MTPQQALDWLFETQLFGIKLGLDGPKQLLKEFLAYPKHGVQVIQIAGTNGKGSTAAMIDSVARAMGIRTGLFTSPHLVHFSERIRVNGQRINEEATTEGLTQLRQLVADWEHHPTFFELTLALAMKYFRTHQCELIILEVGMGGRLDATTAVPIDLAVITPIGMDHEKWLGDTIEKIALEKAGIIRDHTPVICSVQEPAAWQVIQRTANERRAPLFLIDQPLLGYDINLAGDHQKLNAALALHALHQLGYPIREESARSGLASVQWPGRFELVSPTSASDDLNFPAPLILDGAHNPHAATILANTWRQRINTPASLIFGAVESKNLRGVLAQLAPLAAHLHLVKVNTQRGVPTSEIVPHLPQSLTCQVDQHPDLLSALKSAATCPHPILITGSLFLVGEARGILAGTPFQCSQQ